MEFSVFYGVFKTDIQEDGEASSICDNTIMVHIRHIREKTETDPSRPQQLITVKGLGYKLRKRIK